MQTLSCHNNQSAYATVIKTNSFVEANAMNVSAKFQFYSHIASEELIFEYFSQIELFGCYDNQSSGEVWTRSIWLFRGPLNKHFYNTLVKISAMK